MKLRRGMALQIAFRAVQDGTGRTLIFDRSAKMCRRFASLLLDSRHYIHNNSAL